MKKVENNGIKSNYVTYLLIQTVISVGVLSLPNFMIKHAKQDGWLAVFIGSIYPIYIISIALVISRKHPKENILVLSKKYLGKTMGTICNVIYLCTFLYYLTISAAGISNFLRVYVIDFLSSFQFLAILLAVGAYASYKGLTTLAKASGIFMYCIILVVCIPILAIPKGSYLNISPMFGVGIKNMIINSKDATYAYDGIEIIFLLYPVVKDPEVLKRNCIKAITFIVLVYTWITGITIYYLGTDIMSKTVWSTVYAIESLKLPIINNFRFAVMFLWTFVTLTSTAIDFYAATVVIKDIIKKVKRKNVIIFLYFVCLAVSIQYGDEVRLRSIIVRTAPIFASFVLLYITTIVLFVHFKKGK